MAARISMIAAMSKNRVIGRHGELPWNIPEDLRYFKEKTRGFPIIMGRRTFESVGKPLPGRQNIVITRDPAFEAAGAEVVHSLKEALNVADASKGEVFIIGGGEIYQLGLEVADRIYLTEIEAEYEGDAQFPFFSKDHFQEVARDPRTEPERFAYVIYDRTP